MTKYTFSLNSNPSTFYAPKYKSTDYSKILDDLINADIIDKNPWLTASNKNSDTITIKFNEKWYKTDDDIIDAIIKNANGSEFAKACKILENYGNKKFTCPFIKDKIYYLADGTPFYLTDDYITIGFDTYYFYEFGKPTFLAGLTESMKKTIAEIYIDGLKITIKK